MCGNGVRIGIALTTISTRPTSNPTGPVNGTIHVMHGGVLE